jgi:(p)ppGpp synthase/HD superfamily hydrolase
MAKRAADSVRAMPIPEGPWCYSPRLLVALEAAAVMFAATERKGGHIPYLAHLLGVAAIVWEHGGTEDEAIAALLHDTLEDITPTKRARKIVRAFGEGVYAIVAGCTDGEPDRTGRKRPWRERKEAYLARIAHEPASVLLVSAADKLHNARAMVADLRTVGDDLWSRFNAPNDDVLWYQRALVVTFRANPAHNAALVTELDRTVATLERLAAVAPA